MDSIKQSVLFHTRAIVCTMFHPDGDLFFAASKDGAVSMFDLECNIKGVIKDGNTALSTIGIKQNTIFSCGMDQRLVIHDILDGHPIKEVTIPGIIRGIDPESGAYMCTDSSMGYEPSIFHYDIREDILNTISRVEWPSTDIIHKDDFLILSSNTGEIGKFDLRNNQMVQKVKYHQTKICSLRTAPGKYYFVTSSKDSTIKLIDTDTLKVLKVFEHEEPVNSACISYKNDIVFACGGIDARDVTTTKGKGSFEIKCYDVITEKNVGSYPAHFGTINSVDIHPEMRFCCSGGEDGSVNLIEIGKDFFGAPFTKFD